MHLVVGILRLLWVGLLEKQHGFGALVRYRRWVDWAIVDQLVLTFYAGAGLDDAAFEIIRKLGPRAEPILEAIIAEGRHAMVAELLLQAVRQR